MQSLRENKDKKDVFTGDYNKIVDELLGIVLPEKGGSQKEDSLTVEDRIRIIAKVVQKTGLGEEELREIRNAEMLKRQNPVYGKK
ncbi:hypothetical protein A3A95_04465 [Candidatus Nomurabacteria bacterium RIFCSPLOWO2_01_FULL_39_18]|uniref:Uncharacterized protein n=1 Tax=Candidatus Nomurabacteria bacterium RIFCSPHIGHO2_01_FULL_40_24b TaxID=1801739 RepID=A0A1F6V613_9BACT|nr:MAG: hypothetical protein A2647_04060 [Candidatus Nomurabacteria bacterium RIFCSPHIGHO2_01_FULL_40_24b]OGI89350.1 MAG: hypothetical protein A3A95_04465 [Candidatus Nomurabacteria bacterium RIFCSPLOWO2_01_FULL_39_18]